jgi:two-component system cell cycle response regulator
MSMVGRTAEPSLVPPRAQTELCCLPGWWSSDTITSGAGSLLNARIARSMMIEAVREEREFLLTVFGMNPALRTIVVSLCKLYRYRDRSYRVVERSQFGDADIVIVDADDSDALAAWQDIHGSQAGRFDKPVILIGAEFAEPVEESEHREYRLKRTRLSAYLLKTLDTITVRELKYTPELVIGGADEPGAHAVVSNALERSRSGNGHNGKVLVVDDSLSVRTQMDLCLRLHDLAVDFAEDAEAALEMIEKDSYDVIFLDIVLPEMDGYKVCKLVKSNTVTRSTPIVMLTGKTSPFNKVRGVMAGCDRYLTKPVDTEELKTVLHEYIPETRPH